MAAHTLKYFHPVLRYFDTGVDAVDIEQAHAKAGSERGEGNACQHEEGVEPVLGWIDHAENVNPRTLAP